MNNDEIFAHVDHTLLKPTAYWQQIVLLSDEARRFGAACVCIPPSYVERIRELYGLSLRICTVIGFPLGFQTTAVKAAEAADALNNGADEFDMVIDIGAAKSGNWMTVASDILAVRAATDGKILKVIAETCFLEREEKLRLCEIVATNGADYIKTSTGFGSAGATLADVRLFHEQLGNTVKIKAAGGIRSKSEMISYLSAGCDRLGCSSAVSVLFGGNL